MKKSGPIILLILFLFFSSVFIGFISTNVKIIRPSPQAQTSSSTILKVNIEFFDTLSQIKGSRNNPPPLSFRIDEISYKILDAFNRDYTLVPFEKNILDTPVNQEITIPLDRITDQTRIRVRVRGTAAENRGNPVIFNSIQTDPLAFPCVSYQEKTIIPGQDMVVMDPIQFLWEGPGCKPQNNPPDDFKPSKFGKVLKFGIRFDKGKTFMESWTRRAFKIENVEYLIESNNNEIVSTGNIYLPQRYKFLAVTAFNRFIWLEPLLLNQISGDIKYTLKISGTAMENYNQDEKLQITKGEEEIKSCIIRKTINTTFAENIIDFGDFGFNYLGRECNTSSRNL